MSTFRPTTGKVAPADGGPCYNTIATAVASSPDDGVPNAIKMTGRSDVPPEAQQLSWTDDFFDSDADEVIAVFDFDYALMESFNLRVGYATLAGFMMYPPLLALSLLSCVPCTIKPNVEWAARAQHVAITRDGIRFVRDRRKTCWGLPCTDAGRSSKTVPFDKITDCDIEEPAGATCICIKNVLATVRIDTASSGGPQHELKLAGLKSPHSFKKLVWAMKRLNSRQGGNDDVPPVAASMVRDGGAGAETEGISTLLREIRDELRELRKAGNHEATVTVAAGEVEAASSQAIASTVEVEMSNSL